MRETSHIHLSELESLDQLSWIRGECHKDHCETTAAAGTAQLLISVHKKMRFNPQIQQEQGKEYTSVGRVSSEMCLTSLSQGTDAGLWVLGSRDNQVGLEGHRVGK